jgi:hypothetical protein
LRRGAVICQSTTTDPVLAWLYVNPWEGGLPFARWLGVIADAAEISYAPVDYLHNIRTPRPAPPAPATEGTAVVGSFVTAHLDGWRPSDVHSFPISVMVG